MHYLYANVACSSCHGEGGWPQKDGRILKCDACDGTGVAGGWGDEGMDETGPDALPRDDD